MKPWREVAIPHPDVLEGTFQQAEFAADISAVRTGQATREYQDAAKMRLVQIAEEIISLLISDPQATVKVSVEITAEFPQGASDQIKRAVSENATSLGFKNKTWE